MIKKVEELFKSSESHDSFWRLQSFRMYVHHSMQLTYQDKFTTDNTRAIALYIIFNGNRKKCEELVMKKGREFMIEYEKIRFELAQVISEIDRKPCGSPIIEEEKDYGFILISTPS